MLEYNKIWFISGLGKKKKLVELNLSKNLLYII